jgi:CubicO group peptidase (beta-lactamase class C family)
MNTRIVLLSLAILIAETGCIDFLLNENRSDDTGSQPDTFTVFTDPVFPGAEWATADPRHLGFDLQKFSDAINYLGVACGHDGILQTMVARRGYVVFDGGMCDSVHDIWSCTKSFTGTCLGLLIDDGVLSLETYAKDMNKASYMEKNYPALQLRHFVTLTSGYQETSPEVPYIPSFPFFEPGAYFHYGEDMNMLAALLIAHTGESLYSLFKRRIADPIGINPAQWTWGSFIETPDGIALNGGAGTQTKGVFISAREMARFGLLLLNKGSWNGTQLISTEWIRQATSVQVDTTMQPYQPDAWYVPLIGAYGYNYWVNGVVAGGNRKWPHAPDSMFFIQGNFNNNCFVVPEWEMVIVRFGSDQVIDYAAYDVFFNLMGAAIKDL